MFYLVEVTEYMNETPSAKAVYSYESQDEAIARFHQKMGGAMLNENYATELLVVMNSTGKTVKTEYYARPVPAPEPEPEPETVEEV